MTDFLMLKAAGWGLGQPWARVVPSNLHSPPSVTYPLVPPSPPAVCWTVSFLCTVKWKLGKHGSALVSSHSVLTRHGLWEVWPWHQCGHGFQRKTVKSLVEDASCSGRYARHSLRVYSVGAHWIQGRLNQGRTFQNNLYLSWVMNLYKELVLWRRQGWNKLGRYWGMRNTVVLGNHRE